MNYTGEKKVRQIIRISNCNMTETKQTYSETQITILKLGGRTYPYMHLYVTQQQDTIIIY